MKVQIIANTGDENGRFNPCYHKKDNPNCTCDIVDLHEAAAKDYIKRGLALAVEKIRAAEVIETPEDNLPDYETATLKRKKK